MQGVVFTSQAEADAYLASLKAALGYPKPGIDIGGGVHAPAAQSRTTDFAVSRKHPTLNMWVVPFEPMTQGLATGPVPVPATGTVQALDATWFPTPGSVQAVIG